MANRRSFSVQAFTPTATADNTAMANSTYMALGAANATQLLDVKELHFGGQAAASAVMMLQWARDLVLGATPTALAAPNGDGPVHTATAALAAVPLSFIAATTGPSRTNTALTARLNFSFNGFGGSFHWEPPDRAPWTILGTTVSVSETTLSGYTGSAAQPIGGHIIYEPA